MTRHVLSSGFLYTATLSLLVGCGGQLDTTYGMRRGTPGEASLNGTSVLGEFFARAGLRVSSWGRMSPRLHQAHVVVWAPDDFALPSAPQLAFMENWLLAGEGRTWIWIGRDYDAEPAYWREIVEQATPALYHEAARRGAQAQAEFAAQLVALPSQEDAGWFARRNHRRRIRPTQLSGPWALDIDPTGTAIELRSQLELAADLGYEHLLTDKEGGPIVARVTRPEWGNNQLLVVANGSFLLNGPLVHREHRKLAGRLVQECLLPGGLASRAPSGRAIFLESQAGGPEILNQEPQLNQPTGFEALTTWPLGTILMHLAALQLVAGGVYFPIFGRPRVTPRQIDLTAGHSTIARVDQTDFGLHLEALAEQIEARGDAAFALQQVAAYRQQQQRARNP